MPYGVYPVPTPHPKDGKRSLALALRARAWLRARWLDDRLAHGADPHSDRELELRAHRICSEACRKRLARALERLVRDARQPDRLIRRQVPVRRAAIRDCAKDPDALIRRLRDGQPVDPRGIALTDRLLTDGASPLYHEAGPPLCYTTRFARLALDPLGLELPDLPAAA
jgi:hypothetical protein